MHNTELYIENTLIELDSAVHFAITKTFEDITNPAIIINDWSKSIDIPGTLSNNNFFGHIYNPDMQIIGSSTYTYINFDPTRKLDMKIIYDGMLLMAGYAKIIEIKKKEGKIYYSCTLSGQLGKVFQDLSKIRFELVTDTSLTEDKEFIIDTSQFFIEVMDCSHMNRLWMTDLAQVGIWDTSDNFNPYLKSSDIISFTPNNAFSDEFDYKTYLVNKNAAELFTDRLTYHQPALVNQIPADTIYPNGLKPRDIGEFRTYNQLPFIYFNKLFEIVCHKYYELTGYKFILDERWFYKNNPYWFKTVLMLQPLLYVNEQLKDTALNNTYNDADLYQIMESTTFSPVPVDSSIYVNLNSGYKEDIQIALREANNRAYWFNTTPDNYTANLQFNIMANLTTEENVTEIHFFGDAGLEIELITLDLNGNEVKTTNVLACSSNTTLPTGNYDFVFAVDKWDNVFSSRMYRLNMPVSVVFKVNPTLYGTKFRLIARMKWIPGYFGHVLHDLDNQPWINQYGVLVSSNGTMAINFGKEIRSNSQYTLGRLWNFEYKPWDIILNYCRMFRLLIMVDEGKHSIRFIPAVKYFEDYYIEDWTDKLDMNHDFIIKPVYWNTLNVLFNVDNSETLIGKIYNEKYGLNYGEKKIITDYKFDNNTNKLFDKIKTCLASTENVLSWTTTYDIGTLAYTRPSSEILLHSHDADNKLVNPFGSFAFACGNHMWDSPAGNLRNVCISDDTANQTAQDKFYYSLSSDPSCYIVSNGYLKVDVAYLRNLCLFGKPMENYSASNWTYRNDIYYSFWEKYINERYNIQSKQITCYLDIKPLDFLRFLFNKFIKINNQLYFLNKIYDYDIMSSQPTKCDLITIRDVEAYKTDNYQYIDGKVKGSPAEAGSSVTVTVSTNGNGGWAIESPGIFDPVPLSGTGSGESTVSIRPDTTPGDYFITLYRTDSPFSSISEKEHLRLKITVVEPS